MLKSLTEMFEKVAAYPGTEADKQNTYTFGGTLAGAFAGAVLGGGFGAIIGAGVGYKVGQYMSRRPS
jgi:hypothetical protein